MILPKIKQWISALFGCKPVCGSKKTSVEELSAEVKQEISKLAGKLGAEQVSVRDVADGEHIPDEPQIDQEPLKNQ